MTNVQNDPLAAGLNLQLAKVSVIVPTYNRAAYLPATLDTLTHQTMDAAYEIIVVDDGSMDATCEAVAPYLGCNLRYERTKSLSLVIDVAAQQYGDRLQRRHVGAEQDDRDGQRDGEKRAGNTPDPAPEDHRQQKYQ